LVIFLLSKERNGRVERTRDRGTTREWKSHADCMESLHMEDTPQSRMSDHTDGPEAAAEGKKRMLEEHALGGPQGKHRKHIERGVNPANAQGLVIAPAPHPSEAKNPRKVLPSASTSA